MMTKMTANKDLLLKALCILAVTAVVFASLALMKFIFWQGLEGWSFSFLTELPRKSGRAGGISSILVSTFLIVSVCMLSALPLSLATAIYLNECTTNTSKSGRALRSSLDILSGVPSIVFGLFGNAFFCKVLGLGFSILSGGLTLACMVIPLFTRIVEKGLRHQTDQNRFMCEALALSKMTSYRKLILPGSITSLIVAFNLSVGRALAETAALVFTSGYVDRMPSSLNDSGRALSVHIFDLAMNITGGDAAAHKTIIVLLFFILAINGSAHLILDRWNTRVRS